MAAPDVSRTAGVGCPGTNTSNTPSSLKSLANASASPPSYACEYRAIVSWMASLSSVLIVGPGCALATRHRGRAPASKTVALVKVQHGCLDGDHREGEALAQAPDVRQPAEAVAKLARGRLLDLAMAVDELAPQRQVPEPRGHGASARDVPRGEQVAICLEVVQPGAADHPDGVLHRVLDVTEERGQLRHALIPTVLCQGRVAGSLGVQEVKANAIVGQPRVG